MHNIDRLFKSHTSNVKSEWQMEGDATMSVQIGDLREVAELRWDGASEIIRVEVPERAIKTQ